MEPHSKIYISFDFEGIGGGAFWSQMSNKSMMKIATTQLVKFCKGINTADATTDIVISDSYAMGKNLLWEMFPENVQLIKGYPRNYYMVEGLDENSPI